MLDQMTKSFREEEGATAVEYGVMVALIIAVCIAVIYSIGQSLLDAFTVVDTQLTTAS